MKNKSILRVFFGDWRYGFTMILMVVIPSILSLRLVMLTNGDVSGLKSPRNSKSQRRGNIYDRFGMLLATQEKRVSVYIHPKDLNPDTLSQDFQALSKILGISTQTLAKKIRLDKHFVWVKRNLPMSALPLIQRLNIRGVRGKIELRRVYPQGRLLSHVLGFVGSEGKGLEGLEFLFDKILTPALKFHHRNGFDLVLTIDARAQKVSENILRSTVEGSLAQAGTLIAMSSRSGEILSFANFPDYNPNFFWRYPKTLYRNRAVSDYYEPGSVLKIFSSLIFLALDKIDHQKKYICKRGMKLFGRWIRCSGFHGRLNFVEGIKKSCNVVILHIAKTIDARTYRNYLHKFGFGQKTNVELPGESVGYLKSVDLMSSFSIPMMAMGYELGLTPIQLISSVSGIISGVFRRRPKLIFRIKNVDENVKMSNVVRKASSVSRMSESFVTKRQLNMFFHWFQEPLKKYGTAYRARVEGLKNIGGKTGSSHQFDMQMGEYDRKNLNTSFIGWIPTKDDIIVVLIIVSHPKTLQSAGRIVAPAFSKLIQAWLARGLVFGEVE